MGNFLAKKKNINTLDKILELSLDPELNTKTDNFFVLDYNTLMQSMTTNNKSKTDYSDILKTTIESKDSSLSDMDSEMSSINISNTLSEWNTLIDLSKTIV